MSGRLGLAPCGHQGQAVIGQFYNCLIKGCSGTPVDADAARCRKCGSIDLKPFRVVGLPPDAVSCQPCGSVQWPGRDYED